MRNNPRRKSRKPFYHRRRPGLKLRSLPFQWVDYLGPTSSRFRWWATEPSSSGFCFSARSLRKRAIISRTPPQVNQTAVTTASAMGREMIATCQNVDQTDTGQGATRFQIEPPIMINAKLIVHTKIEPAIQRSPRLNSASMPTMRSHQLIFLSISWWIAT